MVDRIEMNKFCRLLCIYIFKCNLIPRAQKRIFKDNTVKNYYDNIDAIIRGYILSIFYPIIQFLKCHRV